MYLSHFGFTEPPFSTTPDPRFVYLSGWHREALAHLLYGVREQGGFVQLTGEVGTGKTTICRYLLGQLPAHVDVALILNPMLTATELLATICDELRVAYPSGSPTLKVLVDALSGHLLAAHAQGRRTVLIVDEAQDLSVEVLEQLRLLTNLETEKHKLLQIILIGQPELVQLLERRDLRQLAQRITARYHLLPFAEQDTRRYVVHRLETAGRRDRIFDEASLREVHRASHGVPRLVNVICDRALLGAYASRRHHIDRGMVRRAAREVRGRHSRRFLPAPGWRWAFAVPVLALVVLGSSALVIPHFPERARRVLATAGRAAPPRPDGERVAVAAVAAAPVSAVTAPRADQAAPSLARLLADPLVPRDKATAVAALHARWRREYRVTAGEPCQAAAAAGFQCLPRRGTWTVLRRFDLPAVLELVTPQGDKHYAALTALDAANATVEFGPQRVMLPLGEIERFWDGGFVVLWRPPAGVTPPLVPGMRGKGVGWLSQRLHEADGTPEAASRPDVYDEGLKARVLAFQRTHALLPDGIAGEETLARVTAVLDPGAPSLGSRR